MIKKFILFLLIITLLGCKDSKTPKDFFIPMFHEDSKSFKSNYSSGIYSKDSIILEYSSEDQSLLKLICGNDTLFSKKHIQYKLKNLKPKLMYIPTASKKYSSYVNNWIEPKGNFSSLQKIKLYKLKDNLILDSTVIQGDLFLDTTSLEMLKHYAEDAGKSEEEIALITEPIYELGFIADGVIIKN